PICRRADLDDLGTVLDLVAHCLQRLVYPVRDPVLRPQLRDAWRIAGNIAVTTGNPDRAASRDDARADDPSLVDGVHQAHVGTTGGTDVPDRSKAGEQRLPRIHDTAE